MPIIRIYALAKGEAATIRSACKFLPHPKNITIQLIAPEADILLNDETFPDALAYNSISYKELNNSLDDCTAIFSSLSSYYIWSKDHPQTSPTVYVYKDMAIMELQDDCDTLSLFHQMGFTLSIISNDSAIRYLNEDLSYTEYPDITCFYKDSNGNKLLITSDHQLPLTLASVDTLNWSVIHPEVAAYNLILDISNNPLQRAIRELQFLFKHLDSAKTSYNPYVDIESLRKERIADKSSYSFFANNYDQYMAHVDYDLWISRIVRWHKMHSLKPLQTILEIACGTANVSSRLVAKGYHVDASDLSANMLVVAAEKPFKPNLYQASLTDAIPGSGYDLIICMFDSINYLLKIAELSQLFTNTYEALANEGIFIFDISTRLNSEENFDDICSLTRSEDGVLVHRAWFEELQMLQKSSLRYFQKEIVGYSQQHELHIQRVYLCSELVEVISHSKLSLKAIYSLDSDRNLYPRHLSAADDKYYRLFFVLKKEQ